ncbi:hypothetical protein C5167_043683 [Papaver somniferum]|uniref:FAE domain-containing protein n=1 Tax=Papaver somniferum TaxID=3469 RepID=A0A4Y7L7F0_PAPSO|nr:hypothetical protein C5167_043683 [Papaver somniferum]
MDKERSTAEMEFKDSSSSTTSIVIKIKKSLPDFLQSVKLKYVKLGYKLTCDYATILIWFAVIPLFMATTIQLTGIRFDQVSDLWRSRGAVDMATGLTGFTVLLFILTLYWVKRPIPVYLVDFSCFKPDDSLKSTVDAFIKMTEDHGSFDEQTIQFQKRYRPVLV